MRARVSFFIKGANPYQGLKTLVKQNGILRNTAELSACIVNQKQIAQGLHLLQVSRHELQLLQMQQRIPFHDFSGDEGNALEPKSVLVVSKDSQQDAHLEAMVRVESTLTTLGIAFETLSSQALVLEKFRNKDLILTVGGDGTFINTARFISDTAPIFGIVSNPQTAVLNGNGSWGNYMLVQAQQLEQALNLMYQGCFEYAALNRLGVRVNDETYLALNEIFINEQDSAHTARYLINTNGITEYHRDSGLLVPAGAGSPINSWAFNANGIVFAPSSRLLQFISRESARFNKGGDQKLLAHGFAETLEVTSALRHDPRISIDSNTHLPFPAGSKALITVSDFPLSLLVFPELSRRAIEKPETVEVIAPTKTLSISPEQIAEIDAMPICSSVPKGTKRQILFLQISQGLKTLNLVRILKTGGQALAKTDFSLKTSIPDPTLLSPTAEISTLPSTLRDIVLNLYSYGLRITEFAGVIAEWDGSIDKNVWGSSIDTIVFIYALLINDVFGPNVKSVGEVGTGGGMISKAAKMFCPNLELLIASDVEKKALECMERNLEAILGNTTLQIIHGKGLSQFGKVDLLLENPPYLPEKEISGEVDPYRGLGLIHETLREGKDHLNPGGKALINYSSCAAKEVDEWIEQYGWKKRVLFTIDVPLKINRVNEDPEWLEFMLEHGGLEIRDDIKHGYKYWQTLNVVELTPSASVSA